MGDNFQSSETILSRIQEISALEGITIGGMERSIGASKGVLSRAISNGTDIQAKWLRILVENYPQYSAEWLLTGKGEKRKEEDKLRSSSSMPAPIAMPAPNLDKGIPLIPIFAEAGILRGEVSIMDYECEHYVIPSLRNADFLIHVHGDSMVPTYLPGDLVACKRVYLSDLFFQWNKTYVLDTNQGVIIKRVKKSTQADSILAVSDNKDYDPFDIPMSCIYTVAIVLGLVRLE